VERDAPSTVRGPPSGRSFARSRRSSPKRKSANGAEKKDIEKDAKKLEHARDLFRERHPYFEFGEVLLADRDRERVGVDSLHLTPDVSGSRWSWRYSARYSP